VSEGGYSSKLGPKRGKRIKKRKRENIEKERDEE